MWVLDCEEDWVPKNWCFWTVVLEKTLESSLACKEIQPVHSKGDQSWVFIGKTDAVAETPILWPRHVKSWLTGKDSDAGRGWGQEEKGTTEDEMAGWHHWLDGYEFEWTPGVGDGQGGLACCDSWGCKESDTTEQLNWTEWLLFTVCLLLLLLSLLIFSSVQFNRSAVSDPLRPPGLQHAPPPCSLPTSLWQHQTTRHTTNASKLNELDYKLLPYFRLGKYC